MRPRRSERTTAPSDSVIEIIYDCVSPLWPAWERVLWGALTFQEQIEWHLRIALLVVGLAVGIMSLVAMIRKL
ncbi:MAG: hypothetical protein ACI9NC_004510 [Verrucomicrobiales bacterium]|jgi:hypothetical protein